MKKYYLPTPIWARKIGDGLLGASATITTYAIAQGDEKLAIIALWAGVAGKFLSNVFAKDNYNDESI